MAEEAIYQLSMQDSEIAIHHQATFRIRSSEIDPNKKLAVPALFQVLHETAMQHVRELKISVFDLEPMGLAWVLMRQHLRIFRLPGLGERVRVFTYPSGYERMFTYRDYHLYDESGACLATSSSTWFMMDISTRKAVGMPLPILELLNRQSVPLDHLERCDSRLPAFGTADTRTSFQVHWYDLDFNGHLNNVVFSRWMLEGITESFHRSHSLLDFQIHFKAEAALGDVLNGEVSQTANGSFQHRLIRSSDQREVAMATSHWQVLSPG